jgi:hypothetical protein
LFPNCSEGFPLEIAYKLLISCTLPAVDFRLIPSALPSSDRPAIFALCHTAQEEVMKRLILFLIAMAAGAQAQQPTPCLKLSEVKVDHQTLHQGSATDVKLKFEARNKDCYVLTESPDLGRQMPAVEVQSEPGITTKVRMVGAMRLDQSTISEQVLKAKEILTTASVTASRDASLGEHALTGTVRYKVMDEQGNVSDEVTSFDVPVRVEPSAPALPPASESFDERHPVLSKALLPVEVVALIALFPLALIAYVVGNWDGC